MLRRPTHRTRRLLRLPAAATVIAALALTVSACGGSRPELTPQQTLARYLAAWERGDWTAMRALAAAPPPDFVSANARAFAALGVRRAAFAAGRTQIDRSAGRAQARVTERFTLPHLGRWTPRTTVKLVSRRRGWRVAWSQATINPSLGPGDRLAVRAVWPRRGSILGAGGAPLTGDLEHVIVGVVGSRMKDPRAVGADLRAAGAPPVQVTQALARARRTPADFVPVFTVSMSRFIALKAAPGPDNLYDVPGTEFEKTATRTGVTPQLAAHVVGSLGPITAEQLKALGAPYDGSSIVGQSGLEASQERALAGVPSTHIDVESSSGAPIKRLAAFAGRAGRAVRTSIDPRIQRAAEAALATSQRPNVSMVAMRASTGQVLAIVSDPESGYDTALQGAYPPGSTFKVLTFSALFRQGLTPSSPASCPPTTTVDGESFHNAEGDRPASTVDQAFTESCNTAFIDLADAHLSREAYPGIAQLFGLDRTPQLGLPAFSANVPAPQSATELAADSIGQGPITFSALGMAQVAAAIDSGAVRAPRLVVGAPDDRVKPSPLPTALVDDLRSMMANVVSVGTAAGTGLPSGTHAKTGTAEYGNGPESSLKIDGWLMGYDGDIAFAIVTQDTGGPDGGPVDGPLIARFLDSLGSGA